MLSLLFSTVLSKTKSSRVDYAFQVYSPTISTTSTNRKVSTDLTVLTNFLISNGVSCQSAEAFTKKLKFSKQIGVIEHTFHCTNLQGKTTGGFRHAYKYSKVIKGAKNDQKNYAIEIVNVNGVVAFDYKYRIDYKKSGFLKKTKRWSEYFWKPLSPSMIDTVQNSITQKQKGYLDNIAKKVVVV